MPAPIDHHLSVLIEEALTGDTRAEPYLDAMAYVLTELGLSVDHVFGWPPELTGLPSKEAAAWVIARYIERYPQGVSHDDCRRS